MTDKKKYTGTDALIKFQEALKKNGKEYWYTYPFKVGKFNSFYLDGNRPPSNTSIRMPVEPEVLKRVSEIIGNKLTISNLRAFLNEKCNATDLDSLDWPTILELLRIYNISNNTKQSTTASPETSTEAGNEQAGQSRKPKIDKATRENFAIAVTCSDPELSLKEIANQVRVTDRTLRNYDRFMKIFNMPESERKQFKSVKTSDEFEVWEQ